MRHPAPVTGRHAVSRTRSIARLTRPVIAAVALLALAISGGVTYALWTVGGQSSADSIKSGDLYVSVGTPTWQQVTPGVSSPASGLLTSTPTDFLSMPGDVIEIELPVTSYLKGDNLVAAFRVSYADGSAVDPDLSVGYYVEDQAGIRLAPADREAALGEAVTVPGLTGDNDGKTADWTVVLRVEVGGDVDWSQSYDPQDQPTQWTAGSFDVDLVQVRSAASTPTAGGGR